MHLIQGGERLSTPGVCLICEMEPNCPVVNTERQFIINEWLGGEHREYPTYLSGEKFVCRSCYDELTDAFVPDLRKLLAEMADA